MTDIDLLVTDEILTFNALAKPDFLFLSNSVSGVQDWLPDDTAAPIWLAYPPMKMSVATLLLLK